MAVRVPWRPPSPKRDPDVAMAPDEPSKAANRKKTIPEHERTVSLTSDHHRKAAVGDLGKVASRRPQAGPRLGPSKEPKLRLLPRPPHTLVGRPKLHQLHVALMPRTIPLPPPASRKLSVWRKLLITRAVQLRQRANKLWPPWTIFCTSFVHGLHILVPVKMIETLLKMFLGPTNLRDWRAATSD